MSDALLALLGVLTSIVVTTGVTIWRARPTSPESQVSLLTASDMLLSQLQLRISSLENQVARQQITIDRYRALHGPLPPPE